MKSTNLDSPSLSTSKNCIAIFKYEFNQSKFLHYRHRVIVIMDQPCSSNSVNERFSSDFSTYVKDKESELNLENSINDLGGMSIFSQLVQLIILYSYNENAMTRSAACIRGDLGDEFFNYEKCLKNGAYFWNYLKTTDPFITAPWYVRDYTVLRLIGDRIKIPDIL